MSAGLAPATVSADTIAQIEREKIRLAYGNWVQYVDGVPFALGLTLLLCGFILDIGTTPLINGLSWLAAATTWAVSGSLIHRYYRQNEPKHEPKFWRTMLAVVWTAHAAIWGSLVWVFWDQTNSVNQAILCTVALGVIVSYFFSLTMYFPILVLALGTLTALQWSAFLYYGGALSHVFMVAFPLFVGVLMNYGLGVSRKYHTALQLRFENEALAAAVMRANQAKSDFLASMSHELRTPLNAIMGYADLMRHRTFGPISPARYATYVEDIHVSGEHLLKMINDLLDLAKIEAGQRDLTFSPVRLSEVGKDTLRFLEPQAERAHVGLMLDFKSEVVIKADERAVKQMAINLLSNAVKFSRPGGIAVLFCEIMPDNRIAFGVKDTGIGMTIEMQQKALEPFAQASDAYTVEGRGTGLGLPIVKGLIEAHQGQIKIESTQGLGSKIWVEFPAERLLRKTQVAA